MLSQISQTRGDNTICFISQEDPKYCVYVCVCVHVCVSMYVQIIKLENETMRGGKEIYRKSWEKERIMGYVRNKGRKGIISGGQPKQEEQCRSQQNKTQTHYFALFLLMFKATKIVPKKLIYIVLNYFAQEKQ